MTSLIIGDYRIDVFPDFAFQQDSTDNAQQYDSFYFNKDAYQSTSVFGVKLYKQEVFIKSVVIGSSGGASGISENSLIAESDRLIICCSDSIFCLGIPSLELYWKANADPATCFEVFKYQSDYIIHGELEISRLNRDGEIIWQRSGADIFTTPNGTEKDFVITDDCILAVDWEGRKYKFDFDGNVIL